MGDHRRSAEVDQDQQPAEVKGRQAVQGSSNTDSATEGLANDEDGEEPHPDCVEVDGNPVLE